MTSRARRIPGEKGGDDDRTRSTDECPLGIAQDAWGGRLPTTAAEARRAADRLNAETRRQRAAKDAEHAVRLRLAQASKPAAKTPAINATAIYRARRIHAELTGDERTKLQEARRLLDDVLGDRPAEEADADERQAPAEASQEAAEPAARIDAAAIYAARRRQASPAASGAPAAPTRPRTIAEVARNYYGGQADSAGLIAVTRRGGPR